MMPNKAMALITALLLIIVASYACSAEPAGEGAGVNSVKIVVTRDFGQKLLLDEILEVQDGTSILAALKRVAEVETIYGGGFVNAIDGLRSRSAGSDGKLMDWFIYVNGILSNTGALDYELQSGDVQHWDFHDWSFRQLIPAIIGDFPEPFQHGYRGIVMPTVIVYADTFKKEADNLARLLARSGINNVITRKFSELPDSEKESYNLILISTGDNELAAELNKAWKRLGFFAYIKNDKIVTSTMKGELVAEYGVGSGIIQATQNPWNPKGIGVAENVVWLISGTDEIAVRDAVAALIEHHSEFQYAFAAVITGGKVVKIPVEKP